MSHFEIDTRELVNLKKRMDYFPRESKRAMVSSLNRALSKIITNTSNEVKKEYSTIKRKDIKEIATIKKATFSNMDASVDFTGARLKASTFPHTISRSKKRSPVTVNIKNARVKSGSNPIMFGEGVGGSRGARGKREIFKREQGAKNVETVYTLSIPQMVANEDVYKRISEQAQKDFLERFEHEFNYRINQL